MFESPREYAAGRGASMIADRAIWLYEQAAAEAATCHWDVADRTALEARDLFLQEDGPDGPDAANISNLLSRIASARGRYASSGEHARAAWEIMGRLGDRCTGEEADAIRLETLGNTGAALRSQGFYAEAERWLKLAIEGAKRCELNATSQLNDLAVLYKYTGRFDEAEQLYRAALADTSGEDATAATIYHNLGGLNHSRGEFAAAEPYARRACEIRERLLGPEHPDTLADACALAGVLDGLGRYAESEPIYRHALDAFEAMFGANHPEVAANLNNLAAIRWVQRDAVEAESLYLRSLRIKRELLGDAHPDTALTLLNYASMLCDLDRQDEAGPMALRALRVFEAALEPSHPRIAAARELLAAVELRAAERGFLGCQGRK
jgi:tetratricopeptide (TPR) repeat protein